MQYISTMDSCHRKQAIEPSTTMNNLECSSSTPSLNVSLNDSTPTNSIEPNEMPINKKKQEIFVPDNGTRKKKTKTKENVDSVLTTLSAVINDIKESLSNDNSNELLKFLKEESAKKARWDEMFLNLMSATVNNNQIQQETKYSFRV